MDVFVLMAMLGIFGFFAVSPLRPIVALHGARCGSRHKAGRAAVETGTDDGRAIPTQSSQIVVAETRWFAPDSCRKSAEQRQQRSR